MSVLAVKPNTPEWLEERKKHIGASDAPAVMGLTPSWRTARELAQEKLGQSKAIPDTPVLRRGRVLEPLVKALFTRERGLEVAAAPMFVHEQYSWMSATPDGLVSEDGIEVLLECKTASRYNRHEWTDVWDEDEEYDIVPLRYWVQVQHQLAVTGRARAWVAVLFAGDDLFSMLVALVDQGRSTAELLELVQDVAEFRIIGVERDEEFIARLIRVEDEFWSRLEEGKLPEELAYRHDSGAVRVASRDEECLLTEFKSAYLQKLLSQEEFEECAQRVEEAIGADSGIYSEFLGKVTYRKSRPRQKTDWKALAQELLAPLTEAEKDEIYQRHSGRSEIKRRLSFPYKYWKLN